MKTKILVIAMILTLLVSNVALADITDQFILIGGDEYISTEAIEALEVDVKVTDDKVIINETLTFDLKKECIQEEDKIFVPFKETLESVSIGFKYTDDEKMSVEKGNKVFDIEFREKKEEVTFQPIGNYNPNKWEDKKQEKNVPAMPYDLKYVEMDDDLFINVKSLELLNVDVNMIDGDFVFKNVKNEKSHKLTIKDVNFGYELNNLVTRVPVKAILEVLEIQFEITEDKLVVDLEGQHVVFHK